LEFVPRLFGQRIAGGAFHDLAVAIDLSAMEATDNDVRPMPRAGMQLIGHRAGQLLRVGIERKSAAFAIWQFFRPFAPAMRRRKNHRQITGDVFDVLVAPEVALAGLVLIG